MKKYFINNKTNYDFVLKLCIFTTWDGERCLYNLDFGERMFETKHIVIKYWGRYNGKNNTK